jgi:hypothetical protein
MILSIIIPTKNRYTTLFHVVDTILSFNLNDDIEIVIQDNSDDNNEALLFVKNRLSFPNLKYFYSSENLSQTGNSDIAVSNSSGDYVCFIGDDDCVLSNIVEVTKWMKMNNYRALKSYKPNYFWPDQKSTYLSSNTSGVLKYEKWKTNSFKEIKTDDALAFTLEHGGVSMKMLPCLYHGIVQRQTLDIIFQKAGSFFPGPSPDMANAIALTQILDSFIFINYPVVISGKSIKSIGGSGVLHQHVAKIEEVKHLPKETSLNWDQRIPKYWTGPTIWAESMIKVLELFENQEALKKINFKYLYAHLLVFNKKHANEIFNNFALNKSSLSKLKFKIFLNRLTIFIKNRIGVVKQFNGIKDIKSAIEILEKI